MSHRARCWTTLLILPCMIGCTISSDRFGGSDAAPAGDDAGVPDAAPDRADGGMAGLPYVALSADQRQFDLEQATTLYALGARMVRLQLCDWPDARDRIEREVDAARTAGLAVYAELNYCTLPAPSDPAERQAYWHDGFTDAGNQFNWQFAAAAGEIAEALRGEVAAYEIWNEPNAAPRPLDPGAPGGPGNADWDGACGDYLYGVEYGQAAWALCPRQLATITTNAFMAIRRGDPAARVVAGNLLYHGDGGWVAKEYLREMETAPAVDWFRNQKAGRYGQALPWDLVGVHPYVVVPETGDLERELAAFNAILADAGDPSRLALTEIGWHTGTGGNPYMRTDEAGQALRLHETFSRARDAGVGFVVWFNYLDSDEHDIHFGVRRDDGSWKDSAVALCDFTASERCPAR